MKIWKRRSLGATAMVVAQTGTCEDIADLLGEWPNCCVPDCEYKACLSLSSARCYAHTLGETPMPFDEYVKQSRE